MSWLDRIKALDRYGREFICINTPQVRQLVAIAEAAQKLVEALPRCTFMVPGEDADTQCFKTAFWDFEEFEGTGNGSFCDEHVHSVAGKEWTLGYPYSKPLRALLAALKEK